MPHLMNCSHSPEGWCLNCVKAMHDRLECVAIYAQTQCNFNSDEAMLWAKVVTMCRPGLKQSKPDSDKVSREQ